MKSNSVYVIAEAGVNHNGCLDTALELVDVAADAGADAVKFQSFKAELLTDDNVPSAAYQKRNSEVDTQRELLSKLELQNHWYEPLLNKCLQNGIEFLSTAFDIDSLRMLEELGVKKHKIASGEIVNGPLLLESALTRKPMIISTGMSNLHEIEQALAIVLYARVAKAPPADMRSVWQCWSQARERYEILSDVTLLQCTSQYPAADEEVNLAVMNRLTKTFGVNAGYSDHTSDILASVAAAAMGAKVIEKHFTLDCSLPGPDHKASLEPVELKKMIENIRRVEILVGEDFKVPQEREWEMRQLVRQQLVASQNIRCGEVIDYSSLQTKRAGSGMYAFEIWDVVGKVASKNYKAGEIIDE